MVAAGIGITVMPMSAVQTLNNHNKLLTYIPFEHPIPERRIVLAWRKSFTRTPAVQALIAAISTCGLEGVQILD